MWGHLPLKLSFTEWVLSVGHFERAYMARKIAVETVNQDDEPATNCNRPGQNAVL